ncbi:hypothetical protein HDU86_000414 [Geranomyces michiganensis]|nr:hypothetical protein HDU86_000414 [Geranomyces michiganensis]
MNRLTSACNLAARLAIRPVTVRPPSSLSSFRTVGSGSSQLLRQYSTTPAVDVDKEISAIAEMFTIAREELEYVTESKGTTYYNDDKEAAQQAVEETIAAYESLKARLPSDVERGDLQRRLGLRILELKAQLDALTAEELEDH